MQKTIIVILVIIFALSETFNLNAQEKNSANDDGQFSIQMLSEHQTGKWRVAINGGFGYRLADTKKSEQVLIDQGFNPEDVDDYFSQIKTGYKISGQVHYMFWEKYGLGFDYQFHNSSGSLSGYIDADDGETIIYAQITDNVFTNFLGVSFYSESWIKTSPFKVYSLVSFGLTMYREETIFSFIPILLTGKAFGGNVEVGVDYFFKKNLAISLSTNVFQSTISKVKIDDGTSSNVIELPDEQKEGLGRIDINLGLRLYF